MSSPEDWHGGGENGGMDLRLSFARHANRLLRSDKSETTIIDLAEHGQVSTNNVRFRDADEPGKLVAYIRQEVQDHKVIIPTAIALGIVIAGVSALKYRKK